jgi:hypothetical protein
MRAAERAQSPLESAWWWGTNRPGGMYYAGRVHVVHPVQRTAGLCGLPVEDLWEVRPPLPEHLCPDCCVRAMAARPIRRSPLHQPGRALIRSVRAMPSGSVRWLRIRFAQFKCRIPMRK